MSHGSINPLIHGISIVHIDIDQLSTARRMAALSAELDDVKNVLHPDIRYAAMSCIQVMQEMVELLAGERIGEIYDLTDEVCV